MKYLVTLLVLILTAFIFVFYTSEPEQRVITHAKSGNEASLRYENNTMHFTPSEKNKLIPLNFDRFDLRGNHRVEFFVDNGFIGLKGQKDKVNYTGYVSNSGFPHIYLRYPSLVLPIETVCDERKTSLDIACPISEMMLERVGGLQPTLYEKLYAREPVRVETKKPERRKFTDGKLNLRTVDDVTVFQWMAFYTENGLKTAIHDTWQGWECNKDKLSTINKKLNAWSFRENLWAQSLDFIEPSHCFDLNADDQGLIGNYLSNGPKFTQHPVLWTCDINDGKCRATFDFYGEMMRLTVPEGEIKGKVASIRQQRRHKQLETAWKWLQQSAQRAEAGGVFDIVSALEQEMQWCEEIDLVTQLISKKSKRIEEENKKKWSQSKWGVSEVFPYSTCSRTMHRIIQLYDHPDVRVTDEVLLGYINRLVNVAQHYDSSINGPLKALQDYFALKVYGENSPELLAIISTRKKITKFPLAVLAHYDRVKGEFSRVDAKKRIFIRQTLGDTLLNKNNPVRGRELIWLALKDWIDNPDALYYTESVWLLIYGSGITTAKGITEDEDVPSIILFVGEMQKLARKISLDGSLSLKQKRNYIATLGMHASWHANRLAIVDSTGVWKEWLTKWYDELKILLVVKGEDLPDYLDASLVHLEAVNRGELTEPNCAGAFVSGCRFYAPQ